MKKLLTTLSVLIVLILISGFTAAASGVTVTIDGQAVEFPGQGPVIQDGRTLVPIRGVFEGLNFDVNWNPSARTATLTRGNDIIIITIGDDFFTTNGVRHELDVAGQLIGGSTMLPLRQVLESVGYTFGWDSATSTVGITSNQSEAPPAATTPPPAGQETTTPPQGTPADADTPPPAGTEEPDPITEPEPEPTPTPEPTPEPEPTPDPPADTDGDSGLHDLFGGLIQQGQLAAARIDAATFARQLNMANNMASAAITGTADFPTDIPTGSPFVIRIRPGTTGLTATDDGITVTGGMIEMDLPVLSSFPWVVIIGLIEFHNGAWRVID